MIILMLRNFKITYLLSIYVVFKTFLTLQFNRRNNFILRRCRIVCVECGTVWSGFGEGVCSRWLCGVCVCVCLCVGIILVAVKEFKCLLF